MGNAIVVLILIVVVILCLKSSLKHFKGEGGCCKGGGSCTGCKAAKKKEIEGITGGGRNGSIKQCD